MVANNTVKQGPPAVPTLRLAGLRASPGELNEVWYEYVSYSCCCEPVTSHIMQSVFVNALTGTGQISFQRSTCGKEFDDYVYRAVDSRPSPFSPVGAASRELHSLWKGRRFKIDYNGKWRERKVCRWKQYNPSDRCMATEWAVEVELDTTEADDKVEMIVTGTVCNDANGEESM